MTKQEFDLKYCGEKVAVHCDTEKISESIFNNTRVLIPMADVQHVEYLTNGCFVIMKSTKYNFEHDIWDNPVYLDTEETKEFVKSYCYFRYEKDVRKIEEEK